MSLIDQRILIEAAAETIWPFLTDPTLLAKWNRAYKQVQIISTKATGMGARRRNVLDNGKTVVEEITAWLENIGYEYSMVDGPFQTYRGRFRLQGTPDGTIVTWTFEYQLKGPLGGMVNVITFRRRQQDLMSESLRLLRRAVEATGARISPEEQARFAMRSAPDADARANRIQQVIDSMPDIPAGAAIPATPGPAAHVVEPPLPSGATPSLPATAPLGKAQTGALRGVAISDDDIPEMPSKPYKPAAKLTLPDKAAAPVTDTGSFTPSFAAEPEATAGHPVAESAAPAESDTKPRPPQGLRDAIHEQEQKAQESATPDNFPTLMGDDDTADPVFDGPTVPISMVAPPLEPVPDMPTQTIDMPAVTPPLVSQEQVAQAQESQPPAASTKPRPPAPDTLPERIPTSPMAPIDLNKIDQAKQADAANPTPGEEQPREPDHLSKRDTRDVSIWEVFGMERPSDRNKEELNAVVASIQRRAIDDPDSTEAQSTQPFVPLRLDPPKLTPMPVFGSKRKARSKVNVNVRPARAVNSNGGARATVRTAARRAKVTVKIRPARK